MPARHATRRGTGSRSSGASAAEDREGALNDLQELFLCGQPADGISGQTEGILVTWTMHPLADRLIGSITDAWMPWVGKKFDPEPSAAASTRSRTAPAGRPSCCGRCTPRALIPLGRGAFDFNT